MDYKRIGVDGSALSPFLEIYRTRVLPEIGRRWRPAVIICPGGAYGTLSDREAGYVALRYQAFGVQAFVLRYSVGNKRYPIALLELATAVKYLRTNALSYDIDPARIFLCGFSAGGHLAANLGTVWDSPLLAGCFDDPDLIRPSGLILCYPVITAGDGAHEESMRHLLGRNPGRQEREAVSLERHVSPKTPPSFLWHTADDQMVSVRDSILFAEALAKNGVPFEMHIFPQGGHGLSLADDFTAAAENHINERCSQWFALSLKWLEAL